MKTITGDPENVKSLKSENAHCSKCMDKKNKMRISPWLGEKFEKFISNREISAKMAEKLVKVQQKPETERFLVCHFSLGDSVTLLIL